MGLGACQRYWSSVTTTSWGEANDGHLSCYGRTHRADHCHIRGDERWCASMVCWTDRGRDSVVTERGADVRHLALCRQTQASSLDDSFGHCPSGSCSAGRAVSNDPLGKIAVSIYPCVAVPQCGNCELGKHESRRRKNRDPRRLHRHCSPYLISAYTVFWDSTRIDPYTQCSTTR